jgi:GntR family transcriptional repressor for pyruvate dehydrogenase complex
MIGNLMIDSYRPVKRQEKLSVQVVEQIIDLIVEGKLKDGDRIPPEREMCETFGVSRTVIREAVSVLEAKGLLESQTGSGTYVRAIQSEDVANSLGLYISTQSHSVSMLHLLEVRRIYETQIAQLAAERASKEDIAELEAILSSMCNLVDDPAAFAEKDLEFHVCLARASGNPLFEMILEPLTGIMLQFIFVGSNLPNTAEEACAHHRAVLDAVKAGDAKRATEAMADHLQQTERVTAKGLRAIQAGNREVIDNEV